MDCKPQPWEQCAKVLREMGHVEDARAILIEKERLHRADRRRRFRENGQRVRALLIGLWDFLLGITVRYGRQPLLAFVWLIGFWAVGTGLYWVTSELDAIKPNNAFVLRASEWAECLPSLHGAPHPDHLNFELALTPELEIPRWNDSYGSQLDCFLDQPEAESYPAFRSGIYSADTLLPIVHLEMQEFWIPDGDHRVGKWARSFLWLQIAMGWALSPLAVAGFSGLVKSD